MIRRIAQLTMVMALASVALGPSGASAAPQLPSQDVTVPETTVDCGLNPTHAYCRGLSISGGGTPAVGSSAVASDNAPSWTYRSWGAIGTSCDASAAGGWTAIDDLASAIGDLSSLPSDPDDPDAEEPGELAVLELVNPGGGATNTGAVVCVGPGAAAPPQPAPLPTSAQVWAQVLTFTPEVHLDPYVRGLTGLETHMWYEGSTGGTAGPLSIGPYTVTATISADQFIWDMGAPSRNGPQVHYSPVAGSPTSPVASHTYTAPGTRTIVHRIVWSGTATLTGPLLPGAITWDLGTAILSVARDYDVIEVRAPVVPGAG